MIGLYLLIFFIILLLGCPVPISMSISVVLWLVTTPNMPDLVMAQKMFAANDSFALMAVPFFMLSGQLMERTGITDKIVRFSQSLVGHIKGGLAHTTLLTGVIMAGISGSSNADAAAIGSILLKPLKQDGYEDGIAVSIVAAAGCLGPIIPPSILMILYADIAGVSIAKLFMCGVVPGLLMALGWMIISYIYAKRRNMGATKFAGWLAVWKEFCSAIGALVMPIIIVGGILTGIVTCTEAGVLAVVYGILYGLFTRNLRLSDLRESLIHAIRASANPLLIIATAKMFSYLLSRNGVTSAISNFCLTYIHSELAFFFFLLILGIFLGMFIDTTASMLMLTPVLLPVAQAMGIDILTFSIIFLLSLLTAGLTPPVGVLFYVVAAIDNTPIRKVVGVIWYYAIVMMLVIILLFFFPQLSTGLASLI